MKLESKIGKINSTEQEVYSFLTNFNNFESLIPADKIKDWESTPNSCQFTIDPVGKTGFKIIEKEPFSLIKFTNLEQTQYEFNFWIQIKRLDDNNTAIKLTIDLELNPMLQMMAKKPVQKFLDTLVDKIKNVDFKKYSPGSD